MFSTTQWTVVFRAAHEKTGAGRPALSTVMKKYWRPLYVFARQQGLSSVDAEDATQAFLSELIEGDLLEKADPAKGRFRTYLLTAWKRFLIDQHRAERAAKRGGKVIVQSLQTSLAEQHWRSLAIEQAPPDELYTSSWATGLVDETIRRLKLEYMNGRIAMFDELLPQLTVPVDQGVYTEIARKLAITEGAAKVALHRLRQRFAKTLREVTAETIEDPAELNTEIDELIRVLAKK